MNHAVFHFVNCIKHFQSSLVMSHHNHTGPVFTGDVAEEFHHLTASMAV